MSGFLFQAFIYLCAAVVAVPLAKRLGLGSVLGYLIAGVVIGPGLGLVGAEAETIRHFAEFGVVMMLFLIGLELDPKMLWAMRARLLGLGGLQVFITVVALAAAALLLGVHWQMAVAIGLILSLSSTAIVLQTLNEKGLTKTEGGRASFAVLLFQDVAVIPMLALMPLLALPHGQASDTALEAGQHGAAGEPISLVAHLPGWQHALVLLAAIAIVVLGGYYLSRPLFRFIAAARLREIFTASALLLVVGIALLMTMVELSPALGTFLAGVVLANSEFRHELESNIEPFKGLLLGLFFITVGASINFTLLWQDWAVILGLTAGVIALKAGVLFGLSQLFQLPGRERGLFSLGLAQAGEFGLVLVNFGLQNSVVPAPTAQMLSLIIALSMLFTPLLFLLQDNLVRWAAPQASAGPADTIDEYGLVVIAGIGRFGEVVNRLLVGSGVPTVVLDHEAARIERVRRIGIKSYYGDAARLELLESAGIGQAKVFVVAIDDRDRAVEMVEQVRQRYPHITILARAFDVNHLYLLQKAGVDLAVREVFEAALELGGETLKALGQHPFKVTKMSQAYRQHERESIVDLYHVWDENPDMASNHAFLAGLRARAESLQEVITADRMQLHDRSERGWTPPPKGFDKELANSQSRRST